MLVGLSTEALGELLFEVSLLQGCYQSRRTIRMIYRVSLRYGSGLDPVNNAGCLERYSVDLDIYHSRGSREQYLRQRVQLLAPTFPSVFPIILDNLHIDLPYLYTPVLISYRHRASHIPSPRYLRRRTSASSLVSLQHRPAFEFRSATEFRHPCTVLPAT